MTSSVGSAACDLETLRRFFLLRYHEEVRRRFPIFQGSFPLEGGSRLDLVVVNGGSRAHFVYGRSEAAEHLVVIHHVTLDGAGTSDESERRHVVRAIQAQEILVHFVLRPPFLSCFDAIETEAVRAVAEHAASTRRD